MIGFPNPLLMRPAPSYWLVWTPSGIESRFSSVCQSCTLRGDPIWRLDTVTDADGHDVKYSYITPDGDGPGPHPTVLGAYLSEVRYRATTVKLYWEHRPDIVTLGSGHEGPLNGGLDAMRDRLKAVEVDTDNHLVRAYALSYDLSPTSQESLLSSVQEYGDTASVTPAGMVTGADSQPPTRFCYQSDKSLTSCGGTAPQPAAASDADLGAQPDGDLAPAHGIETNFDITPTFSTWTTGDFNGDTRSDFVALGATPNGLSYQVELSGSPDAISPGDDFEKVLPWSLSNPYAGTPDAVYIRRAWPIDLAGHGIQSLLVDIVIVNPREGAPLDKFYLLTATDPQTTDSSAFQFQYSNIDVADLDTTYGDQITPYCTVADFNGDGIDDFACVRKQAVGGQIATEVFVRYSVDGVRAEGGRRLQIQPRRTRRPQRSR